MTWHATRKCTEPSKDQHPVDGKAWKNFDTKYLNFAKEPRNVRLGLAADGFNPPLIDDLKVLWAVKGLETIDVATGQKFNMRVMVLWTINDFPARSSLSGWSGLEFFQHVFLTMKGYKLPSSYYAIKKTFKTIRLGYESIHACVNDYILFRGNNNKDVHFCLVCKTSRWKDSNTPGKKVPKKVLRYILIIPRLQHLYKSSHTAKEMTWHATRKCTEPSKDQHPVDGKAWKNFDTKYLNFAKEPRNVRLGLAADGFNPFGNLS
nr:hypothetical protein [Tanacetum cinerariifolium]